MTDRDPGDEDDTADRLADMKRAIERGLAEMLRPFIGTPVRYVAAPPVWPRIVFVVTLGGPPPPDHDPGDEDRGDRFTWGA